MEIGHATSVGVDNACVLQTADAWRVICATYMYMHAVYMHAQALYQVYKISGAHKQY